MKKRNRLASFRRAFAWWWFVCRKVDTRLKMHKHDLAFECIRNVVTL